MRGCLDFDSDEDRHADSVCTEVLGALMGPTAPGGCDEDLVVFDGDRRLAGSGRHGGARLLPDDAARLVVADRQLSVLDAYEGVLGRDVLIIEAQVRY